jgi:hypothetical protein
VGRRTLLGYGGSQSIDSPASYSRVASGLLIREIGIDTERFATTTINASTPATGCGKGILFERARFGASRSPRMRAVCRDAAQSTRAARRLPHQRGRPDGAGAPV